MSDPRVEAIRQDPVIGRGTCSSVDECYEDKELVEHLDKEGIVTEKAAVTWARGLEQVFQEQNLNARWGEDSDPQLAQWNEWKQKLQDNPL